MYFYIPAETNYKNVKEQKGKAPEALYFYLRNTNTTILAKGIPDCLLKLHNADVQNLYQ